MPDLRRSHGCSARNRSHHRNLGQVTSRGQVVPITASVVDQQASLYGHGCRQAGDAKITFGTGAFALMVTGHEIFRSPEQGLLPTVAWQLEGCRAVHALDGGVYCAGRPSSGPMDCDCLKTIHRLTLLTNRQLLTGTWCLCQH